MVSSEVSHFVRSLKTERAHATLKRGRRESRVRAAPTVSCALMHKEKCAHEHTGSAETLRPSLRNGLTTYTCSPWRPGFLVTIIRGPYRRFDANPGASGPHAFAVRIDVERLRHQRVHRSLSQRQ